MDVDIHKVHEHYEIYIQSKFYCSADNMKEVAEEMENYSKQLETQAS